MRKLSKEEAAEWYKEAIDEAVTERNIELLVGLISKPQLPQETRDYLAGVIEDLLSKRKSFPNRKPKQDLEEKCCQVAARVLAVKKEKGWKLRAVVDLVAEEMRCSPSSVWAAWRDFGPALLAGDHFRHRPDIAALVDTIMTAGREGKKLSEAKVGFGKKLSDEQMNMVNRLPQEILEFQDGQRPQRRGHPSRSKTCDRRARSEILLLATVRSKKVRT